MKTEKRYQCSFCNKKSKSEKKITECEAMCKKKRDESRAIAAEGKELRNKATSINNFAELIQAFITKHTGVECVCEFKAHGTGIDQCSNSHSSPIGKKSNWGGRNNELPTSYMGWRGDFNIILDSYSEAVSCVRHRVSCLHTGTGGSRDHGLGWNCTLWADDFPLFGHKMYDFAELKAKNASYEREETNISTEYQNAVNSYVESHEDVMKAVANLRKTRLLVRESATISPRENVCEVVTRGEVNSLAEDIIN